MLESLSASVVLGSQTRAKGAVGKSMAIAMTLLLVRQSLPGLDEFRGGDELRAAHEGGASRW